MNLTAQTLPGCKNDGTIPWDMNNIQLRYREQVISKINTNIYMLENVEICLCGSKQWICLSERDRHNLPFGSVICKECGLIRTTPRMTEQSLSQFYDEDYLGLNFGLTKISSEHFLFNPKQGEIIHSVLKPYLDLNRLQEKIVVCEIGAATGQNLLGFSKCMKDGIEVELIGCDYSEASVKAGKKNNINIYVGDASTLVETQVNCDIVILSHVLEHFCDIKYHLSNVKRIMDKNCLLYIEVPGVMDLKNKPSYKYMYSLYVTGAHIWHFNQSTLRYYVEQEGFSCVYSDECCRSIFKLSDNNQTENTDLSYNCQSILKYLLDTYKTQTIKNFLEYIKKQKLIGTSEHEIFQNLVLKGFKPETAKYLIGMIPSQDTD